MRKFSQDKINESSDSSTFRYKIKQLMDFHLKVGIYGPIDPILQGTLKIEGEENFLNALMGMLDTKESKSEQDIIENLIKSNTSIYERLQQINVKGIDSDRLCRIHNILDLKDVVMINEQLSYMKLNQDELNYINKLS